MTARLRSRWQPSELAALRAALHTPATVPQLLARACVQACERCGFERGVVLSIDDGVLSSNGMGSVEHAASDALRRRALAHPIRLAPGSPEAELVRRAEGFEPRGREIRSVLAGPLRLGEHLVAPVVPEARAVALLVVDRSAPVVADSDRSAVELFAYVLGLALERVVLRARMTEVSAELRHLTASATALAQEASSAPVTLSTDYGFGQVFAPLPAVPSAPLSWDALLSARELEVVGLMARGLSNREIGAALHLAPDTVKAHVGRILRKLGVSNRVEAVARYMALRAP